MRESKLTAEGFRVEKVESTKYTTENGSSFISVGDSTATNLNKKTFEERLKELKDKYEGVNDFDFVTILKLEDEFNIVSGENTEHTRRRQDILDMRRRLLMDLRLKS